MSVAGADPCLASTRAAGHLAGRMLKSWGQRLVLSMVGSLLTCFLVLVVEQQKRQELSLGGEGAAGFLLRPFREEAGPGAPSGRGPPAGLKGAFSDYFSQLSRGKREAPPRGGGGGSPQPPQLEQLSPRDVFIAVKTTKKFHKSRLELLLDTWISRNQDMVRGAGSGFSSWHWQKVRSAHALFPQRGGEVLLISFLGISGSQTGSHRGVERVECSEPEGGKALGLAGSLSALPPGVAQRGKGDPLRSPCIARLEVGAKPVLRGHRALPSPAMVLRLPRCRSVKSCPARGSPPLPDEPALIQQAWAARSPGAPLERDASPCQGSANEREGCSPASPCKPSALIPVSPPLCPPGRESEAAPPPQPHTACLKLAAAQKGGVSWGGHQNVPPALLRAGLGLGSEVQGWRLAWTALCYAGPKCAEGSERGHQTRVPSADTERGHRMRRFRLHRNEFLLQP